MRRSAWGRSSQPWPNVYDVRCTYCEGKPVCELVDDTEVYRQSYDRKLYLCRQCGAYVGCHKNSDQPLGTVARKYLRMLRSETHNLLDPIWRTQVMERKDTYQWLADQLGINVSQCHIGYFREDDCKRAIEILKLAYENGEFDTEISGHKISRQEADRLLANI